MDMKEKYDRLRELTAGDAPSVEHYVITHAPEVLIGLSSIAAGSVDLVPGGKHFPRDLTPEAAGLLGELSYLRSQMKQYFAEYGVEVKDFKADEKETVTTYVATPDEKPDALPFHEWQIKCHGDTTQGGIFKFGPPEWRPAKYEQDDDGTRPYLQPFRTCSYCGSIHPNDLIEWMGKGATLDSTDWKYGWPHKFYVRGIPNPIAGKQVEVGSKWENGVKTPMIGDASPEAFGKFYSIHLQDMGVEWIRQHGAKIFQATNIAFHIANPELRAEMPELEKFPDGRLVWVRGIPVGYSQ